MRQRAPSWTWQAGRGALASVSLRTRFATTPLSNEGRKELLWTAIFLAAALLVTSDAKTQQQPAAGGNPLDVVPEKNTPYGSPISLEKAQTAVQAAVAEANKRGWPLNVAVVDFWRQSCHICAHGWRSTCLHCHLRAQGTGRSKISSANQSD